MKTCADCKREAAKGYTLRNKFRCDQCFEDFLRRDTRIEDRPASIDRNRRSHHMSEAR